MINTQSLINSINAQIVSLQNPKKSTVQPVTAQQLIAGLQILVAALQNNGKK
jgi:hypothetical protein